jgi:tRNA(Ile)-lysidine synthase
VKIQEIFNSNISRLLGEYMPKKIAAAVSGGPDSMLMCYMAQNFCRDNNIELHVVIVDHMLRDESSTEAKKVSDFLKGQGIIVHILRWEGDKPSSNIQAIARKERYKIISSYCKDNGIYHLITGHHADDQAETVFMRIMRGSGIDGVSGIKEDSCIEGISVIRPMLSIYRDQIVSAIKEMGWHYVEDPSNKNEKFSRVKVRNFLSQPQWEFMKSKLVLLGKNAGRSRRYLDQQTNLFLKESWMCCSAGTYSISIDVLLEIHEEIALRSLCRVLMHVGGSHVPTRLAQLERIYTDLRLNTWKDRTLFGCLIRIRKGNLIVIREWEDIPSFTPLPAGAEVLWDGRFIIKSNVDGYVKKLSIDDIKICLGDKASRSLLPYEVVKTLPFIFSVDDVIIEVPNLYKDCNYNVLISLKPRFSSI